MSFGEEQGQEPWISVIVATRDRRDDVAECLAPLTPELLGRLGAEVIVVDDASTDGTAEMLASRFSWVRTVVNRVNVGPGPARNAAAAKARGQLLVFIDSDAVPCDGWLETLAAADDGEAVLIGRVLDYRTGAVQYGPRRATFLGKSLRCRPGRVNTGGAGNMAVPKRLFDGAGGFDPEIPNCFEDSWLCIRLGRAGARFRYVAEAMVRHKGDTGKHGDEIRMQEHNSTYAMLKFYSNAPVKRTLFNVCNALWMGLRWTAWNCTGRGGDAGLLWEGWATAYRRFAEWGRVSGG
jgi:GT2 family glycosyltransferase